MNMDIQISYKHSAGDPNFPDHQMFSGLTNLDPVFDVIADKCLYKRVTGFFENGHRYIVYHPMGNDRSGEALFLYYLNNIFSAKISLVECKTNKPTGIGPVGQAGVNPTGVLGKNGGQVENLNKKRKVD
jgi:hypothetical protein